MRSNFAKLLKQIRKNFPDSQTEVLRQAYRIANKAHHGQVRRSGEYYIIHSLQVSYILAKLGLDPITCAAAILHDVIEDTDVTRDDLEKEFGEEIATLVDGVTKVSGMGFARDHTEMEMKQAANLRKMLVATAQDVRVILIKLADRLHNMRTIEYLEQEKIDRICRETLDIYAPLAHRLGVSRWRWELEDHAFHHLMPEEYKEISRMVAMKRREREQDLHDLIQFLQRRLTEGEVNATVIGRPKHLYSIHQKMVRQGKTFDQIMDVQGVRIITKTEGGCYNALGLVHSQWPPMPGRLKDYIAMPKMNMYQAIHTTVMRDNGRPLEIQIRSEEMDHTAREGIAAHWIYKEGGNDKRLDSQLNWLRQMYEWLKDTSAPDELMESMRSDFKDTFLYIFTPNGDVKELPAGATPLDFAYMIHSDIGNHCIGARVNDRMVPFRYHLQTGDMVEILTSKNQNPSQDWLNIVTTGRARARIRQRLREIGELAPVDTTGSKSDTQKPQPKKIISVQPIKEVDEATRQKLIRIQGFKGMAVQFAKCCKPMPGHAVIGYITKAPRLSIHKADCKSFAKSARDPGRIVEATWEGEGIYEIDMHVLTGPRPNVLADITNALRPMNLEILKAVYGPGDNGNSQLDFTYQTEEQQSSDMIIQTLRTVTGVSVVKMLQSEYHQKPPEE